MSKEVEKNKVEDVDSSKLLKTNLWAMANLLRGKMDAGEYKNYILGFIFLKYLSEKLETESKVAFKNDNKEYKDIKDEETLTMFKDWSIRELGFYLRPDQLFNRLVEKSRSDDNQIVDDIEKIFATIEKTSASAESSDDFANLFDDVNLNSSKLGRSGEARNKVVCEIIQKLSEIDFDLENTNSDVLGDAYEYMLYNFAAGAGKKGGEFYTPAEVSELVATIVADGRKRVKSVYDPTCGSGSLLLKCRDIVKPDKYLGQELNTTTHNLSRMNMIIHNIHFTKFSIKQGDTLSNDQHKDKKFDAIVANPPFSAKWKGDKDPTIVNDDRFSQYGGFAPKSKADLAFVQHMIYKLTDDGTMVVVLPHGPLFRGGGEKTIREHIIKNQNFLHAVIGLPANIFFGTSIPTCIMVFKKCRKEDDKVLFIDASKEFVTDSTKNKLSKENIKKIWNTYKNREVIDKFSNLVSREEIEDNDYNLNIPRYVDTFEEEEKIDLKEVSTKIKQLKKELENVEKDIKADCDELGIDTPF